MKKNEPQTRIKTGVCCLSDMEFPTPNRDRMYKKITRTSDGKTGTVIGFADNGACHIDWDDKTSSLVPADVLNEGYEISENMGLACAREGAPPKKHKLSDDPDDMPEEKETEEETNRTEEEQ